MAVTIVTITMLSGVVLVLLASSCTACIVGVIVVDHELSSVLPAPEAEDNNTVAFDLRMANLTLDAKTGP